MVQYILNQLYVKKKFPLKKNLENFEKNDLGKKVSLALYINHLC